MFTLQIIGGIKEEHGMGGGILGIGGKDGLRTGEPLFRQ